MTASAPAAKLGIGAALGALPVLQPAATETDWTWQALFACERAAAIIVLLLALPLLAACALALWIISGCSPLIAHRRVGWRGAPLWMFKLRTMRGGKGGREGNDRRPAWIEHIDDDRGPELKSASDSRVCGRFARFCRRHSIDELPQLWHVISGEMSLVGPRPMTPRELNRYYGAHSTEVLQTKPGLTGLWQISGRNRLTYAQRCRLDLRLVREPSIRSYCAILLRTVPEIFRGKNTW
jgi:exopolysaccharide production protein ExoY